MKPKLAYVTLLYPTEGGYKNRLEGQLELLSRHFEIHFIYFLREKEGEKSSLSHFFATETRLEPGFGRFVSTRDIMRLLFSFSPASAEFLAKMAYNGLFHGVPLFFAPYFTEKARQDVAEFVRKKKADVIWSYGIFGAAVAWDTNCKCKVADLCDSISYLYSSLLKSEKNPILVAGMAADQQICKRFERKTAKHFDFTLFANQRDAVWLGLPSDAYHVLPNVRRASKLPLAKKRHDVFLAGIWSYMPNRESLEYTCKRIFPLINVRASIAVAGRGMDDCLTTMLKAAGLKNKLLKISVLGEVSGYKREVCKSKIYLLPIWSGAGTTNKALDALEAGIPALTTPHIKSGMDPEKRCDAMIACKSAQEFATWLEKLIADNGLQKALGKKARSRYLEICGESLKQNKSLLQAIASKTRAIHR